MSTIEHAILIAVQAHRGQVDKADAPYILHPLRLMLRMESDVERMVAVLHDVVEDSAVTLDDLRRAGFADSVINALDCLTHRPDEPYEHYIARVKGNALASRVKLADLEDNMDIRRLDHQPTERDWLRLKKYRQAWALLRELPAPAW